MPRLHLSNDGRHSSEMVGWLFGTVTLCAISILGWSIESLYLFPLSVLLIVLGVKYYGRFKEIEFDEKSFFYKKGGAELEVPLSSIQKIGYAFGFFQSTGLRKYHVHKIVYTDQDAKPCIIRFLPEKNLEIFMNCIKDANAQTEIELVYM